MEVRGKFYIPHNWTTLPINTTSITEMGHHVLAKAMFTVIRQIQHIQTQYYAVTDYNKMHSSNLKLKLYQ